MSKDIPKVAEIVRHWMPDASEEELEEATVTLWNYLAGIYQIVLRLEVEGKVLQSREKFRKKTD